MSKQKPLEYKKVEALSFVGDIDDVAEYDTECVEDDKDKIELEKLIYFLSAEEISILVLRHLGYKPNEIYKIMHLHSLAVYRKLYRSLKMRIYLFKNIHNGDK